MISQSDIDSFNQFNLKKSLLHNINKRLNKNNNQTNCNDNSNSDSNNKLNNKELNYQLKTVRFVPQRVSGKGKNKYPFKIEAIIEIEEDISEQSFLAQIIHYYNEHKDYYKKPKLSYHQLNQPLQDQIAFDYIQLPANFTNQFNCKFNVNKAKSKKIKHNNEVDKINNKVNDKVNDKNTKSKLTKFESKKAQELAELNKNKIDNEYKMLSRVGGLDPGVSNVVSLALSHGKNQIYAGKVINQTLTHLNMKLDKIKSSIFESYLSKDLYAKVKYNQSVAQQNKEIVSKNKTILDKEEHLGLIEKMKLNVNELQEIKEANRQVYSNLNYNKTLVKMSNYKNNILHQLSEDIITRCVRNNIQCLIIGHNDGWKEQLALNKTLNRLFMTIPYNELITMLRYKGMSKGMVVLTTEESYTSKASFINNDKLPIYENRTKKKVKANKLNEVNKKILINELINENELNSKDKLNEVILESKSLNDNIMLDTENNHSHQDIIKDLDLNSNKKYKFNGSRSKVNRHDYHIKSNIDSINKSNKIRKIHADLNGAFNIIRKVCLHFSYHELMSLDYELRGFIKHDSKHKLNSNKGKRISVMFSLLHNKQKLTRHNKVNTLSLS